MSCRGRPATEGEEALVCLPHIFSVDISFHIYKMETLLSSSQDY